MQHPHQNLEPVPYDVLCPKPMVKCFGTPIPMKRAGSIEYQVLTVLSDTIEGQQM